MTAGRRLVVVLRWPRGATLQNAVVFSFAAHVAFVAAVLVFPALRGRPDAPLPTLDVVLVSPLAQPAPDPSPPTPPAARPKPPEPKPEPEPVKEPEGPSVTPEDPPEPPVEKPKPRPKPVDPEPTKEPEPPAPEPRQTTPPTALDPDQAATQAQAPIGGAAGGALAGMGTEFNWYRDSVVRALYTSWRQPFAANLTESLEVTIAFEINRDGSVSGVRLAGRSGHSTLDRSAFRAVLDAQLPPLPRNHGRSTQPALFVFRLDPQTR